MKKTKIAYWVVTSLFAFMMLGSSIPDILSSPVAVQGMHDGLGYPVYFIPFIGVAKFLGVLAILVPGFPRLREWAYAGLIFDLLGATYSLISVHVPLANVAFMPVPILLGITSYILYQKIKANATAKANVLTQANVSRHKQVNIAGAALG